MNKGLLRHRFSFNIQQWIPEKHQWIAAYEGIQDDERKRISQFVFKEDAKASLIGRILLRYMIYQLTDVPWCEIFFKRSNKGKPLIDFCKSSEILLKKYPQISVNVSHSGDYVIGVADISQLVGVDIMDIRNNHGDVSQFFGVMKRNFTPREWDCIYKHHRDEDKMKLFYRHWCLKESFVKAIGKGIGYTLQRLSFNVDPDNDTRIGTLYDKTTLDIDGQRVSNWYFEETMLDGNHCAAVTTKVAEQPDNLSDIGSINENFTELNFRDLQSILMPLSPMIADDLWVEFDKKLSKNR